MLADSGGLRAAEGQIPAVCMPQRNICFPAAMGGRASPTEAPVSEDTPVTEKGTSDWQWAYSEVSQMWPLTLSTASQGILRYASPLNVIHDEHYYFLSVLNKTQANRNTGGGNPNKVLLDYTGWK